MTNPPLPDDELASALVDGLGDDEERARLASDPALAARVEQLRAVRHAVATSAAAGAPPSAEARERAVAAALAAAPAHELPPHELPAHEAPSVPVDLDARRRRRQAWLPAAAAAAVVAVLGLGAFAALRNGGADGDSQVTAAADSPATTLTGAGDLQRESTFDSAGTTPGAGGATTTASTRSGQDATGAGAATTAAAATTAPTGGAPAPGAVADGLPDLGSVDSTDALRAALAALAPIAEGPGAERPGVEAQACASTSGRGPVARLTWVGQPALVLVVDGPPSRAVVVTATDCHPLAEVPLP